jgi:hypothetical protein
VMQVSKDNNESSRCSRQQVQWCAVFWDRKGTILLDFLEPRQTIKSDHYTASWRSKFSVRPKKTTFLLQYDNTRPYTRLKTMQHTAKFGWTVVPHPLYSPDLASSEFYLFKLTKDGLCTQTFCWQWCHHKAVRKWVVSAGTDVYECSKQDLVYHWRKCIASGGDYV